MKRIAYAALVARTLGELIRYDLLHAAFGFRCVYRAVERQRVATRRLDAKAETHICNAVTTATCLYYKRVYCLQRSAVAARLLKKSGVEARLVIGFRPSPFFSHAWVEVDGRVINDSPAYKERMRVLCSF